VPVLRGEAGFESFAGVHASLEPWPPREFNRMRLKIPVGRRIL
jgi:hypothetical protein